MGLCYIRSLHYIHICTTLVELWGPLRGPSRAARETRAAESARITAITSRQCKDRRMTLRDFNHLLSSLKALSPEQMRRLREQIDSELAQPKKPTAQTAGTGAKRTKATLPSARKPLTEAEFDHHLLSIGLMSQLPDTAADVDDPDDQLIDIRGEPLSETVIRERR